MLSQNSRYGDIIKPAVKLVASLIMLGLTGAFVINVLESIPRLSFLATALTEMVVGMAAAIIVIFLGEQLSIGVKHAFRPYPELFSITYSLIQVLAIVVVYFALQPIFNFLFADWYWAYSVTFVVIALVPGLKAGLTIINSIDKWLDKEEQSV